MREFFVLAAAVWALAAFGRPAPRPALLDRLNSGVDVIGIIHWGLNTYTDREWGYGDEDQAMLGPNAFDADAIVAACKAGGLGMVAVKRYFVDPELVKVVMAATSSSGETDTAKWMTGLEKEKRN